jgi:hypothetical protein
MIRDESRFRRHRGACPYYRENWTYGEKRTPDGELLLYEVYCLKGWPPTSTDEQSSCMCSVRRCWRNGEDHRVTPDESAASRATSSV